MPESFSHEAYVGLGSNIDQPVRQLRAALAAMAASAAIEVIVCSSLYRSAPVGFADQPDFVNAVVRVRTDLGPVALLDALLRQEREQGRQRTIANGPRTLDLDLLLFDALRLNDPGLTLPHPRMHERAFVLVPLTEIAPEIEIPGRGRASALLAALGTEGVERMAA
jgi:2-amino-4-hydroxy-6-hydroxymethyldihydropteridine diphosphokinase